MYIKDLIKLIPNCTNGKIRDKNEDVICDGKLLNDQWEPNFPIENISRKICTIMAEGEKLLFDSIFKNINIGKFVFIRLSNEEWK